MSKRTAFLIIVCLASLLLGDFPFARWRARQIVAEKRVTSTAHLLCKGMEDYRLRMGRLTVGLDQITNTPEIDARWLQTVPSILSVSYKCVPTDAVCLGSP